MPTISSTARNCATSISCCAAPALPGSTSRSSGSRRERATARPWPGSRCPGRSDPRGSGPFGRALLLLPLQVPHDEDEGDDRDVEELETGQDAPEDDLPDAEEGRVDEEDPEAPVQERHRPAGDRLLPEAEARRDARPAGPP